MASLRSRRQPLASQAESRSSLRRARRTEEDRNESKEPLSKRGFVLIFVLVCSMGLVREYYMLGKRRGVLRNHRLGASLSTTDIDPPVALLCLKEDATLEFHTDHTRYQVIFSTDCSPYQHWQSYLVFFSAIAVQQPGHVTRIASGCSEEETLNIQEWFQTHVSTMSTRFHLHLTPPFSEVKNANGEIVGDYKFFNKPFGLKHWMENADNFNNLRQEDDVVILIDPDMVLLRPLVGDFSSSRETLISPRRMDHMIAQRVEHGKPFAQTYGLGTQWQTFDLDTIAGPDSPAKDVSKNDGFLYFPAGPPYIATARDMYQIALKWTEFVPRVHAEYPHLLAEMYAFCIAAAHLKLRFQLIDSLMISNTAIGGEGWPLVDNIPAEQMCEFAAHPQHDQYAVPSVVHLCQRYAMGDEWFFGKHKVPHDIYSCEHPLLMEPPANLAVLYDFKRPPNQKDKKPLTPTSAGRETFMVCFLTSLVNQASISFKQNKCPAGTANFQKSLKMVDLFGANV